MPHSSVYVRDASTARARDAGHSGGGSSTLERQVDVLYQITLGVWIGAPAVLALLQSLYAAQDPQQYGLLNFRSTLALASAFGVVSAILYSYGKLSAGTGLYVGPQCGEILSSIHRVCAGACMCAREKFPL